MIQRQQDEGLDKLGLNCWGTDRQDGFSGKDGRSLRHGPNVTGEPEAAQEFQKLL